MFLVNVTLWSFVGALAGIEGSGAVLEAVTRGDIDTARRLLKVAESGKCKIVFVSCCLNCIYTIHWIG